MITIIETKDIETLFPRPLDDDERTRAGGLIDAALELIEEAFLRHQRDFRMEVETDRLLQLTVKRVVREMISEAIHIGENVGLQSASSTTGPQSDSITFSQGVGIHWGGVHLTDQWLRDLGLLARSPLGFNFPPARRYAGDGVSITTGVEFAERRRR